MQRTYARNRKDSDLEYKLVRCNRIGRNGLPMMRRAVCAPCRYSRSSGYPHFFSTTDLSGSRSIHLIITGRHRDSAAGCPHGGGGGGGGEMGWLVAGVGGQSVQIHNRNPDVQPRRAALPPSDKPRYLPAHPSHVVPEVLALALPCGAADILSHRSTHPCSKSDENLPWGTFYSKLKTNREVGYVQSR